MSGAACRRILSLCFSLVPAFVYLLATLVVGLLRGAPSGSWIGCLMIASLLPGAALLIYFTQRQKAAKSVASVLQGQDWKALEPWRSTPMPSERAAAIVMVSPFGGAAPVVWNASAVGAAIPLILGAASHGALPVPIVVQCVLGLSFAGGLLAMVLVMRRSLALHIATTSLSLGCQNIVAAAHGAGRSLSGADEEARVSLVPTLDLRMMLMSSLLWLVTHLFVGLSWRLLPGWGGLWWTALAVGWGMTILSGALLGLLADTFMRRGLEEKLAFARRTFEGVWERWMRPEG